MKDPTTGSLDGDGGTNKDKRYWEKYYAEKFGVEVPPKDTTTKQERDEVKDWDKFYQEKYRDAEQALPSSRKEKKEKKEKKGEEGPAR